MWKKIAFSISASLLIACAGSDDSAPNPEDFELIFPLNNSLCLEGRIQSDLQSQITFDWTFSRHAASYDLTITNLSTNEENTYNVTESLKEVVLNHYEPYTWKVTALGDGPGQSLESDTWKFYLAGEAETNYAPFPAELISPRSGATVILNDGQATLNWSVSDVDDDLATVEIYLDTNAEAGRLLQAVDFSQANQQISATLEDDTIYYWRVRAIDSQGNRSDSGTYAFRTQ